MKKILTLLFVILCLTLLATPAMAYEGVDSLAIVGDDIPGVAMWLPDDPAGEMEETAEGIFVKEIALTAGSTMTFKFAANDSWELNFGGAPVVVGEAAVMTPDGSNMVVSVDRDTTLTFTVDLTGADATLLVEGDGITETPEIPEDPIAELETLAMLGEGLPTLNWDPADPANEMTRDGNIFTRELSISAGTTIIFKFAGNGDWGSGYNFGSGIVEVGKAIQLTNHLESLDMTYTATEDCILKFTVDTSALADGGNATMLVEPLADVPVEETTVTVHAKGLPHWDALGCWAWLAPVKNAFEEWPGEAMTKDGEWYTIEIPDWCDHIIINNFSSTDQSIDVEIEPGKDVWITVLDQTVDYDYVYMAELSYEEPTAHVCSFTEEWFHNDREHWHQCVDCGAKSGLEAHTWQVATELLETCVTCGATKEDYPETVTIYVDPFDDWEVVSLFAYTGTMDYLSPWPGEPMTDTDGDGWYELVISSSYENLILSNNGLDQTKEILTFGAYDMWISMHANADGSVEIETLDICPGPAGTETTPVPAPKLPETLSIVGEGFPDLIVWDQTDPNGIMDEISAGVYVKEFLISGGTELTFKFVGNQDWASGFNYGAEYATIGSGVTLSVERELHNNSESKDLNLTIHTGCRLRFTVDLTQFDGTTGAKLLVEEIPTETVTVHVHAYEEWGVPYCFPWLDYSEEQAIYLWNNSPGGAMTQDGDWYIIEIPVWCENVRIYRKNDLYQSTDLEINGEELWIVVTEVTDGYGIYEAQGYNDEPELEPAVEDVTVHVQVPADWEEPHCWAWRDSDTMSAFRGWPGEPLTKDGDWYTIQIPGWCDYVIINANNGSVQTNDLEIDPGKEVWLVCAGEDAVEIYYEEPALEVPTEPTEPTEEPDEPTDPSAPTEESVETESTYPKMTRPHDYDEAEKQSEKDKDSGSLLTIILIAVGAVVLLGGGVTLILVLKKKKKA